LSGLLNGSIDLLLLLLLLLLFLSLHALIVVVYKTPLEEKVVKKE
jgi:hypothetical protein